nr:MurR/RpiR family transcriptional regulator [Nocardioides albus]
MARRAQRVVQTLARAPELASYASAREIAELADVNVSTVVRTAQQLGFEGWPDLREQLRATYLQSVAASEPRNRSGSSDLATATLEQQAANVSAVITDENTQEIRAIAKAIRNSRRTVVIASGSGGGPAQILAYLVGAQGADIHLATGAETAQAAQVAHLSQDDCLIVLNVWRLTRSLRDLTILGHENGATVAVITDLRSSPLSAFADHVVAAPITNVDRTPSLTAMVAVVQAIISEYTTRESAAVAGRIEKTWDKLGLMFEQS